MARDEGLQGIRGQILNIPVTCHPDHNPTQGTKTSYHENAHAPIVDAEMMRWFWKNYLPTGEADSRSSPLLETSLQDMPPALVQVAGRDPLRDEGIAYAKRLTDSGVNVTLKLYSGLPHAFHIYPELEATAEYIRAMIDWIKNLDGLGMTTTSTLDNGENSSSYSYEPGQLEP
ncbi:hypothetical protein NW762_012796 [Fusarium torreyae]|uniref:Alpha/beta hydrolase fold-3 domain-containing protein n=1 Tax=Fusarium torreyae TaxID=1237075 RepID=A0A9W8V9D8_9HYPO|nr:hypothetical protein NW762_012796 [Fusarium torreyae]